MTSPPSSSPRLLLLGWQGIDWSLAQDALAEGLLPNLARLVETSVCGMLTPTMPRVDASLWTTLVTGRPAYHHGILHAAQPAPGGVGIQPIARPELKCATLGVIQSAARRTVHQIGWPVSHPVERLQGIAVSDRFALEGRNEATRSAGGWPWVSPASAAGEIFNRRYKAAEVDDVTLAGLIPHDLPPQWLQALEPPCRVVLAESLTNFRCAKFAMEATSWDALVCCFPTMQRLQLALSNPACAGLDVEYRARMLTGGMEHLDILLGQLLAGVDETDMVAVATMGSPPAPRPALALRCPGVESGQLPPRAHLLDVVPTLLALLDLPIGRDMEGRPWSNLLPAEKREALATIDSWDAHIHPPAPLLASEPDPFAVNSEVEHLVGLGYVDPFELSLQEQAELCRHDTRRNRILSLIDAGLTAPAIEELRGLHTEHPEWLFCHELLAEAYLRQGRPRLAAAELEVLAHEGVVSARYFFLLGRVAAASRDLARAEEYFHVSERQNPTTCGLHQVWGVLLVRRRRFAEAAAHLRLALESEGNSAAALDAQCVCALAAKDFPTAAEHALDAVAVDPLFAPAHFHLALALVGMERAAEARQALQTSTQVSPEFLPAWRRLAWLERETFHNTTGAELAMQKARDIIRQRRPPAADA